MTASTSQIVKTDLDNLVRMTWNNNKILLRKGHNPAQLVDFITAVDLQIIVLMNVDGSGDQDDVDAAVALASPEAAIASIDALANP